MAIVNTPMENPGSTQVDLRKAISNLDALPAMPVVAQKLLALQMGTEESIQEMLMLIEQDPQISAKIIGLANSAMIAASSKVLTTKDAVMMLGIARVYSVSIGIAIMSLMNKMPAGRLNLQGLWLHSFGIAFAMLGIARAMPARIRPHDDQVFLAGLLHDIGYLVLASIDPKRSDELHARMEIEPDRPALEIENEMMEMSHAELGSELAHHWNLPDEIIAILRYHHMPDESEAAAGQPLVRMINIAEKILTSFGISEYVDPGISNKEWKALGIDPANTEEIRKQVAEQAEHAMQFTSTFARLTE